MIKLFQQWGGFLSLVATIVGGYFVIDSHYAKAEEFKKLEMRVEQKILSDRVDRLQERIWKLEDRYPQRVQAPNPIQQQWRELEKEQKAIEFQLQKAIENSQKGK